MQSANHEFSVFICVKMSLLHFRFGRYFGWALNSMFEMIFFEHFKHVVPLFLLTTWPSVLYSVASNVSFCHLAAFKISLLLLVFSSL